MMGEDFFELNRRTLIGGVATSAAVAAFLPETLWAKDRHVTPWGALGPFYPVERMAEQDADLTRLAGHKGRAKGEVIEVSGRVLLTDGTPQSGARIELWQCNAAGRYLHHGDSSNPAPVDPDFQGFAMIKTGADGSFRFLTIKPPPYPADDHVRSPHIHIDVTGKRQRRVAQLYMPTDAATIAQDKTMQQDMSRLPEAVRHASFATLEKGRSLLERGADLYRFDLVLAF